ncbi:hypothetical protein ETU09_09595 [Apibacter muscae]|uniref:Uncharacterized protein n=1 Tax=Apibacter muscae TaxID=2509004 RepID=A0A563DAJ3_9FLAO|nr:hypothetical protein [Apibacter muscae]TWP26804.1 hypothetical protein ETU09_09595 [Apibacter muscae]
MKKVQITLFLLIFFSLSNCNGQNKDEKLEISKNIINNEKIIDVEKILKKQIMAGASGLYDEITDGETYNYESKDLEVTIPILKNQLQSLGFKFLDNNLFDQKIKIIFGRIIDSQSNSKYLYLSPAEKCQREILFNRNRYTSSANIPSYYIIKNDNFITDLYAIPELINYQKEYPEIAKIEDTIDTHIIKDGIKIQLYKWKAEEDLINRRRFNQQLLVARNKYLFNDDKSQFVWLTNNDEYFMRSLVTTFGYTEDKKLLNWVIENTDLDLYSLKNKGKFNYEEFGSLFWTKKCNGVLKLHPNTFKLFQELYKPNDNSTMRFLLDNIKEYLNYLFNDKIYNGILTKEERLKIGANLVYFAEQYKYNTDYNSNERMMGRLRYFLDDDSVGILMKNNYYNLPKFKQWWDKALYDQDYVIECEYDGVCGRDNPGPDPRDPKYKYSFLERK